MLAPSNKEIAEAISRLRKAYILGRVNADNENYLCPITLRDVRIAADALEALAAERDEADRRAGAAERLLESLQDDARNRNSWLWKAKKDAGYDQNISFDVVWSEALAALKAARDELPLPPSIEVK